MLGPDRPEFVRPSPAPTAGACLPISQQQLAVRQFVARVGGIENARRALELLAILSRAA